MQEIIIRKAKEEDYQQWHQLFHDYQQFYRSFIPEETIKNTWKRLLDDHSKMGVFVAEQNGTLTGIVHYMYHDSTWNDLQSCYLEDLFVSKATRGTATAKMLIDAVEKEAKKANAFRLYWHTQEYNGAARSLYDSIMPRSSFIVYRKNI